MKFTLSAIFFLLVSVSIANGIPTKTTTAFAGKVVEANSQETLTGVQVSLVGTNIFTFTDKDGNFEFPAVPEGDYKISFSLVSFSPQVVNVSLTSKENPSLQIALQER